LEKLVSIIMPAYNVEKYVRASIRSIQQQTYNNWELIVVNDGSTDNTGLILESLGAEDNRIRIITQQNGGSAKARNTGLTNVRGEYVAFLDADDLWRKDFLTKLVTAIEKNEVDMVYCGYTHLYAFGLKRKFSYSYKSGDVLQAALDGKIQIHIGATLIKRILLDRHNIMFTDGCILGEDQEFILKLLAFAKVKAVPEELMLYRIRPNSAITSKWKWEKNIHAIYGLRRVRDFIAQNLSGRSDFSDLVQSANRRIAYKLFKFLWRMVKNGYNQETMALLANPEIINDLKYLPTENLKLVDKLKYNVVFSQNPTFWKIAHLLS